MDCRLIATFQKFEVAKHGTAPARSRVVRGGSRSRDLGRRAPSPKAINQEAGDWLEENASRLAIQTQKCLLIHRQLQDLLSRQGSPTRNGASMDEVSWQSKTLSLQALEGAPLDLLDISEVATSERRDKLRADLTLAEEDVNRLKEEIRVEQAAGEQFNEALEAGTKVELRRLKEEVSVLEATWRSDGTHGITSLRPEPEPPKPEPPKAVPAAAKERAAAIAKLRRKGEPRVSAQTQMLTGACDLGSPHGVTLPEGLQSLTFGDQFNQSLQGVAFPSSLESLIFGAEFNQSFWAMSLPNNLRSLTFGVQFN
eukprot:s54_g26.t1